MVEDQGKLELLLTIVEEAKKYATDVLPLLPEFDNQYVASQALAKHGKYKRTEMPVINDYDFALLKGLVASGAVFGYHQYTTYYETLRPEKLIPLQKQIWVDKCIDKLAKYGLTDTKSTLATNPIIVSIDNHVVDGHHRWLSGMLLNFPLDALVISLPADKLLRVATELSDMLKHRRNR